MIDILGFGGGFDGTWRGRLMVDMVGMKVDRSHFSPIEAMEETCAMI